MYAETVVLMILKGKDEVLVKMSHLFRYTWDKFGHILSHHFKSIKAMEVKLCTTAKAIEIHILTINKVHKKLHFLRHLNKKKKNPLFFKSPFCSVISPYENVKMLVSLRHHKLKLIKVCDRQFSKINNTVSSRMKLENLISHY